MYLKHVIIVIIIYFRQTEKHKIFDPGRPFRIVLSDKWVGKTCRERGPESG